MSRRNRKESYHTYRSGPTKYRYYGDPLFKPRKGDSNSPGERRIKLFLLSRGLRFTKQKSYSDCKDINKLPFDFYLDDFNTIIEYDGMAHYQPVVIHPNTNEEWAIKRFQIVKLHDQIKNEYCKANRIDLIRISYKDFEKIEVILNRKLDLE